MVRSCIALAALVAAGCSTVRIDGMLLGLGIGVGVAMVNGVERGGERGALAIIGAVEVGLASALVLAFIGGAIGRASCRERV